jgi:hypothetical protein
LWLTGLIGLSAAARFALAYWMPAPWIFADELVYSELGKSFARSGHFAIRDAHGLGFGPLYPLLISPAYAAFENVPHAYLAIKAINSVVMSLAAVPAFFLARRLVSRGWALAAAALAVAVPSMAYTGMVLTENLFYPLFLTAVLAIVRALERPRTGRQLVALGMIAAGVGTRPQAVALVPALLTAILLVAAADVVAEDFEPRPRKVLRRLGAYLPTLLGMGAGLVALIAWESLRGRSVFAVFGAAEGVWHQDYSVSAVGRWFLYHVAELDLYAGVLPFAAFLILSSFLFARDRTLRVFVAVAVSAAFWLLLAVSAFMSSLPEDRHTLLHIEDRYTFYVVPLLLIALAAWLSGRLPRSTRATVLAGVAAGLLPLVVPYGRFIRNDAIPDTFALLPWARVRGSLLVAPPHAVLRVGLITLVLGALFYLLRPPRLPRVVLLLVLLNFLAIMSGAQIRTHGSSAAAAMSIQPNHAWIDEAIGPDAEAVVIWSEHVNPHVIWENEFFNRSVGRIYYLRRPSWEGLPEQHVTVGRRGRLYADDSAVPVSARYVLLDPTITPLRGRLVAVDQTSAMRLFAVDPKETTAPVEIARP